MAWSAYCETSESFFVWDNNLFEELTDKNMKDWERSNERELLTVNC